MKIKRLFAAILSAMMIVSCFSFTANAQETQTISEPLAIYAAKDRNAIWRNDSGGMDKTLQYDAVTDRIYYRATPVTSSTGTTKYDSYGITPAVTATNGAAYLAYDVRTNVQVKPSVTLYNSATTDGGNLNNSQFHAATATAGNGEWERVVITISGEKLSKFSQVHQYIFGRDYSTGAKTPADAYMDMTAFAFFADEYSAKNYDFSSKVAAGQALTFSVDGVETTDVPTTDPEPASGYFMGWSVDKDATRGDAITALSTVPKAATTFYAIFSGEIEDEKAVYISANGDDANNGRHSKTPVKTLAKANELLAGEGIDTLYVVGNVDGTGTPGISDKKIYIEGYSGTGNEVLTHSSHWKFGGDVEFSNITLADKENDDGQFIAQGHDVTFNSNVKTAQTQHISQGYYGNFNNIDNEVNINGGNWNLFFGPFSGSTITGKTVYNIDDKATVSYISLGKRDGYNTKGETYINVNGGTVALNITNSDNAYEGAHTGLRYFTLNGGTVSEFYTRSSRAKATLNGITVFEINEDATITPEKIGVSKEGTTDDSEARVVIFNDGATVKTVEDTDAMVIKVTGGNLHADVTVASDYTTTLNGFTYDLEANYYDTVKIGDKEIKLSSLANGVIPASEFEAGLNTVEFFEAEVNAPQTVVYVSANGDNANRGDTAEAPIKTLKRARELLDAENSQIATVYIMGTVEITADDATTTRPSISFGAADRKVTYLGYGENAILDAKLMPVYLIGEVEMDNFFFQQQTTYDGKLMAEGHDITIGENMSFGGYDEAPATFAYGGASTKLTNFYYKLKGGFGGDIPTPLVNTINVNGGSLAALQPAIYSGDATFKGEVTVNLAKKAKVSTIRLGGQGYSNKINTYGTIIVNVDDNATVNEIVSEVGGNSIGNYSGLREININGGSVGTIKTTAKASSDKGTAEKREQLMVITVNDGTLAAVTKPHDDENEKSTVVLIFNDGVAPVAYTDKDAYILDVTGANIAADTTVSEDYTTATLNKFTYTVTNEKADRVVITAGETTNTYALADLGGEIALDKLAKGTVNEIVFEKTPAPAQTVVYVSATGADTNNGATAETAVATLARAYEIVNDENNAVETIYIVGEVVSYTDKVANWSIGQNDKTLKIKGADADAKLTFSGVDKAAAHRVNFYGNVTLEDITLDTNIGGEVPYATGTSKSVTIGKGVKLLNKGANTLLVGGDYADPNFSTFDYTFTVNGTDFAPTAVIPGAGYAGDTKTGSITAIVNAGTIPELRLTKGSTANGSINNEFRGTVKYEINGGKVDKLNFGQGGNFKGFGHMVINGGEIGMLYTKSVNHSWASWVEYPIALTNAGVFVFEINGGTINRFVTQTDTSTNVKQYIAKNPGATGYPDTFANVKRVVIFNDGVTPVTVEDTGITYVLNVTGGKVTADVTVAEDKTNATLNKFKFTTTSEEFDQVTIKVGENTNTYKLADLNGEIALDKLTAGTAVHEITFSKYVEAPKTADYTIEIYTMGTDGAYGEAVTETKTANVGEEVLYHAEEKTGFTISTGSTLSGTVTADGLLTLAVYYDRNSYKLYTKADAEAEAVVAGTYYYEEALTAPATPEKDGYTFKAWDPTVPATMPANDVTLTATWEKNAPTTATLKFYDGDTLFVEKTVAIGATLDILPLMSDVKGGNHATYANDIIARPAKKGYKLVGWATTNGGEAVTVTATADASYYAVWEEVNELKAGEDFTLTIVDGTTVTASPVPADAISFIRGDDKNSFAVNSNGVKYYDTTVTDLSAYGVSFVAGKTSIGSWYGGSDAQKTVLCPDGTKSIWYKWNDSYISAKPGVEGEYNVAYWIYTGSEGSTRAFTLDAPGKSGVVYLNGAGTKDHFVQFKATLTADSELKYSAALDFDDNTVKGAQLLGIYIWKDAPVVTTANATFNANGGAWGEETTKVVETVIGETPVAPEAPVKEGFTFKGWTPELKAMDADGETYTAVWEALVVNEPVKMFAANTFTHFYTASGSNMSTTKAVDADTKYVYYRYAFKNGTAPETPAETYCDSYANLGMTVENGLVYYVVIMRTNQTGTPNVRPLQGTGSDDRYYASAPLKADGTWERVVIKMEKAGLKDFKQMHMRLLGEVKTDAIRADFYYDIAGYAFFNDEYSANNYDFTPYIIGYEEANAVYVNASAGNDANSGRTSKFAVKTLKKAEELLKTEGLDTLYVIGNGQLTSDAVTFGVAGKTIKVRGYTGSSDVFDVSAGHIRHTGSVDYDNITIKIKGGDGSFMAQGNDITIGTGVVANARLSQFYYGGNALATAADSTITLKAGTWSDVHVGNWTDGNYYGTSTIVIDGATVGSVKFGHGSGTKQTFNGTGNVILNNGTVSSFNLDSATDAAVNSYNGLRYFTLNGGKVTGNMTITSKDSNKDGSKTSTATGVTVIEINAPDILDGSITKGKADDPDAQRIVIYNNDSYVEGKVTDADAIVIKAIGAKLHADITVAADFVTTTHNGYTYELPEGSTANAVKIGEETTLLADLGNAIPASKFAAGVNTVEFVYIVTDANATFNANGGKFADGTDTKTVKTAIGEVPAAPANPERAGYTFAGWEPALAAMVADGATYTAKWEVIVRTFENAVYLGNAGNDDNDGLTPATLVKTLKRAQAIVLAYGDIDTIVVVGTYSKSNESSSSTNDFLNGANRKITITGQTVESVFDMKYGSSDSHLRLGNNIEFNNLKMNASSGDGGIMSMGYELTFGEGMTINSQKAGFLHYNAQLKDNGVVNVYSGTIGRLDIGVQSGQTWRGTSTINVYGGTVGVIRNGHGWKGNQAVYGINNVNVNGGSVGYINMGSSADTAVTNYSGLRYFTINDGTVGDITITGSSVSKVYDTDKSQTASVRAGVTVVEYNGGTIGTIKVGTNQQTGAADPDDATRVVILNNNKTANVTDADAIVVKAIGGKLHAATNAQETYPADRTNIDTNWGKAIVLKGFTYELPAESTANAVKIDGAEAVLLDNYANDIITGITTAGEHTVEFVTVEVVVPEETNKIYLDQANGNDENNGETAASAVKTIKAAQTLLAGEKLDTLVIVGQFLLPDDDANNKLGYADKTITITGNDANATFAIDNNISGESKWNDEILTLQGDVVFKNITLIGDDNDSRITVNGNKFVFGEGVKLGSKPVNENNNVSVAVQSIPAGKTPEITVKSGAIHRLLTGPFNAGTVSGTVNINVAGKDAFVQMITIAHNYNSNGAAKYGITNVTVDDGAVTTIGLTPTGTVSVANYDGLRHYVINGGSVANIELAGIKTRTGTISGKESTKTATLQSGVNVVEINGGTVGKIYRSESDIDDSVSAIIFNNGTYAEGIVTDTTAIVADVKGGVLTAQTTAPYAADATAAQIQEWSKTVAITGYAFTTDKAYVRINGTEYAVSEFVSEVALTAEEVSGVIPADKLTAGYNSVTFSDVEIVTIKFVIRDVETTAEYEVGELVEFPEVTVPAPTKDEYYVFDGWVKSNMPIDAATFTAPAGGATLEAAFMINTMPESAYRNYDKGEFSQVNNVSGVFTTQNVTKDGVEAVKIIPGTEGNAITNAINIEGSGKYPSNFSTGVDGTTLDPTIYEYAVYKYYYESGSNQEDRELYIWYQKHPWQDTTLVAPDALSATMETNKWTYVVDKLDRADGKAPDLTIQFHIRPMNNIKASVTAQNNEYFYIDSMYVFKSEPTVATVTFKGEDGAILYAIDALNSEAVAFGGTTPEKADHEFLGWAVEGTTEVVDTFAFAEDTTLVPVFKSTVVVPETTAKYKTYGVYDEEAGTYTVELKFTGAKVHMGSFGFVLPGLISVTAADGITLFAEEEATGAVVSPIFAKGEDFYANTWAIEAAPGYIDATQEEVLIATFVLEADASFPEKFEEYVVDFADAKYFADGHYLVAPKSDSLDTDKIAVIYESHTDSIKEIEVPELEYKTYGTYNPADGSYTIEVKFIGGKINAGAFGIAFNSDYMTYDPEADGAFVLADGIANYLDVALENTADGIAFVWDGSADAENGFVDATDAEVLIATIKAEMSEDQRAAYEAAGTPAFELLDITGVEDAELYFNGTDYLVALYADDLAVERVAAKYIAHADEEAEVTTADVTVKVTFADKAGATTVNLGYITVNGGEAVVIDDEGNEEATVEYVIEGANVGETLTIKVEKNGYLAAVAEVKVSAAGNTVEITTVAGDIKESTEAISGDGEVDLSDFIRVVRAFDENATDNYKNTVDLNEDGAVNVTDLGLVKANFNKTSADVTE